MVTTLNWNTNIVTGTGVLDPGIAIRVEPNLAGMLEVEWEDGTITFINPRSITAIAFVPVDA